MEMVYLFWINFAFCLWLLFRLWRMTNKYNDLAKKYNALINPK